MGVELTQSQIKAYESGATMFMFPCPTDLSERDKMSKGMGMNMLYPDYIKKYIEVHAPIQKGDKDIFVKEEGIFTTYHKCYKIDADKNLRDDLTYEEKLEYLSVNWQPASEMTKEQSRYSFSECIDVKVVRVQDINILQTSPFLGWWSKEVDDFAKHYNQQMKELGINRTYNDNDYVFLVEFK